MSALLTEQTIPPASPIRASPRVAAGFPAPFVRFVATEVVGAPLVRASSGKAVMKSLARAGAAAALALGSVVAVGSPANAASQCWGSTYSGRCIATSNIVYHSTVVETVPLTNKSKYTATMNCGFTTTVSRSYSNSVSLTASLKASVWGVAEASISGTQQITLTQTASQATTAGGSVKLPPGGKVICQRVYGYYTMKTVINEWGPGAAATKTLTSTVPYSFGVTIRNG